jgi:cytochrome c oxidase assembly protein subunit 15
MPGLDGASLARLVLLALAVAALPLAWVSLRSRRGDAQARLTALVALTLFLTFDLVAFGAFTRLSDSGLGCPDWPGCYGSASPLGAREHIAAAQAALPSGPVTHGKAWIEMVHRYLAMTVGLLIVAAAGYAWRMRRQLSLSPWWPTATLAWVVLQGLFGKYTVTWRLYPAIVTLHLVGGLVLLALLALQWEALRRRPLALGAGARRLAWAVLAVLAVQIILGGWVSTNYAVLACTTFPDCNGQWWPAMDFGRGFAPLRELGHAADGSLLPQQALVAIHFVHRAFAVVALAMLLALAWALRRSPAAGHGCVLAVLTLLQAASGVSNVVLGWPLPAALAHTAGAAGLVLVLVTLLARSARGPVWVPAAAAQRLRAAS